ncbi:Holliday junction branch migration protein RuvA [Asticcacaulis machinosus]|uniref:Holliday junction branch migration complex subunit RuvA n=1 Tax=Asticcacaulis machinosus TaxID=2984211 RepID=A0ABT5HMS5_9CAUL|nr:Holliday junction branch migration protein RuvA [Asticcacaulis machinosus]MDC7677551.1 Holliday junction branch migration protein RuvA [Asticcacaulis machinosus]
MIGRLRGLVLELSDEEALIEVGGVGYIVRCGVRTLANMPELGTEVIVHIESVTREDGTRLFGFLTKDERQAFVSLQGVQGVGPKAALAVLDIMTPSELAQAVASEDKAKVGRASGVGPKLAQRIVIELKGKPLTVAGAFEPVGYSPAAVTTIKPSVNGESVAALMGLGMSEQQSRQAVEAAVKDLGPEAELAAVIRASLKALGR